MTDEQLSAHKRAAQIALAKVNPNDFIELVWGVIQAPLHRRVQGFLTAHESCHIELPRGHGKTTQLAGRVAWEIGCDPNIRIKIVQQNDGEARKTAGMIRDHIGSAEFQEIFPAATPDARSWGKEAFTVKRTRVSRDPTVEACSIFGRAGGRYDLLIGDDVCDMRNAIQQPALRSQVKEAWANTWAPMADPTGDRPPREWTVGTPWHVDDITADWRKSHNPMGSLMREPVDGFESPWPEKVTEAYLKTFREKKGPTAYARAYLLEPISDEDCPIKREWVRYWQSTAEIAEEEKRVIGIDPAISKKSRADYSVLVEAVYAPPDLYVINVIREHLSFPELLATIRRRAQEFKPHLIAVESVAYQQAIGEQLLAEHPFPIRQCKAEGDKHQRAAWLAVHIENGKIKLRGTPMGGVHPAQQDLFDELTTFPAAEHDDTLDALFYAAKNAMPASWPTPGSGSVQDLLKRQRDKLGYTRCEWCGGQGYDEKIGACHLCSCKPDGGKVTIIKHDSRTWRKIR